MEKKLISLEDHNRLYTRKGDYFQRGVPVENGIACPKCGEELFDSDPMNILFSCPPQKSTMCKKCGYTGYRFCWKSVITVSRFIILNNNIKQKEYKGTITWTVIVNNFVQKH